MNNLVRPITEIPIDKIYPHPHNPRKNLGELSELANSIKQSGVLQNLTVIPGRFLHPDEYVDSLPAGADPHEALDKLRADPSLAYDDTDDSYTVIIGHRRLAAARLAGLSTVPVAVVEMDFRTQLATMMAENVQRADLTPFEQADGFQLMMDLGMSADEVARETGFSVSTVRRRVKLTQLNREKLPDGAANYTLFDLERISEINSPEMRDKLMLKLGSDEFGREVSAAKSQQIRQGLIDAARKAVAEAYPKLKELSAWQIGGRYADYDEIAATDWISDAKAVKLPEIPKDKKAKVYGIKTSWEGAAYTVRVIFGAKKPPKADKQAELTPQQKENAAVKEMRDDALMKARNEFWRRRCDFVRSLDDNLHINFADIIARGAALSHESLYARPIETLSYLLGVKIAVTYPCQRLWEDIKESVEEAPLKSLLCIIYSELDPAPSSGKVNIVGGKPAYDDSIDIAYKMLEDLGYIKEADEIAYYDGSSELLKLSHYRPIYRAAQEAADEAELTAEAEEAAAEAALEAGA